jgi:hypothetical protein
VYVTLARLVEVRRLPGAVGDYLLPDEDPVRNVRMHPAVIFGRRS